MDSIGISKGYPGRLGLAAILDDFVCFYFYQLIISGSISFQFISVKITEVDDTANIGNAVVSIGPFGNIENAVIETRRLDIHRLQVTVFNLCTGYRPAKGKIIRKRKADLLTLCIGKDLA